MTRSIEYPVTENKEKKWKNTEKRGLGKKKQDQEEETNFFIIFWQAINLLKLLLIEFECKVKEIKERKKKHE